MFPGPSDIAYIGRELVDMDNKDVVRTIFTLFAKGETEKALEKYHDDVVFEAWGSTLGGKYLGHQGLIQHSGRVAAKLPGNLEFDIIRMVECENTVLVEIEGRTESPDGKEFQWQTAEVFEMREQKVAGVRLYTDTETIILIASGHAPAVPEKGKHGEHRSCF